jgi:hypothetical protein
MDGLELLETQLPNIKMENLYAKSAPEWTSLKDHLHHVSITAKRFAKYLGMDEKLIQSSKKD